MISAISVAVVIKSLLANEGLGGFLGTLVIYLFDPDAISAYAIAHRWHAIDPASIRVILTCVYAPIIFFAECRWLLFSQLSIDLFKFNNDRIQLGILYWIDLYLRGINQNRGSKQESTQKYMFNFHI
ncbi:hypothetical protein [Candidatus Erwinia dacicola]|uniref:Uncharacterized protein n=1 Tax=Candidatus Erwinia dacicola TaxID=252393 RepID=A0A1E7Z3S5_9GAMM|nr:hypothetical protein [Candidatus Erwinia dacicola]OFC63384.1 hypothetical protein BBW68_00940 [Candidatus Erwinia dacicola]RAP71818.1 hypothetical protein ACZ87_01357 [Candidatus Erwinia dacicola]